MAGWAAGKARLRTVTFTRGDPQLVPAPEHLTFSWVEGGRKVLGEVGYGGAGTEGPLSLLSQLQVSWAL